MQRIYNVDEDKVEFNANDFMETLLFFQRVLISSRKVGSAIT